MLRLQVSLVHMQYSHVIFNQSDQIMCFMWLSFPCVNAGVDPRTDYEKVCLLDSAPCLCLSGYLHVGLVPASEELRKLQEEGGNLDGQEDELSDDEHYESVDGENGKDD